MKTYHKSELAKLADVSYSTFYRFLKNRRTELDAILRTVERNSTPWVLIRMHRHSEATALNTSAKNTT